MCYDIAFMTRQSEQYARRYGTTEEWEEVKKTLPPTYHASGFDAPDIPVITNEHPEKVQLMQWGFVPMVYAPKKGGRPLNTLNARNDNIYNPRSIYRKSAESKHCLVMIDGWFDHHKKDGVAYPHYVQLKNHEPFMIAGLWQTFVSEKDEIELNTVTLITGPANKEVAWVHNEPAYSPESRMVYVVSPEDDERWLFSDEETAMELIKPLPDDTLEYYPCEPIKSNKKLGRVYLGNVPEIQRRRRYLELEENQGTLF